MQEMACSGGSEWLDNALSSSTLDCTPHALAGWGAGWGAGWAAGGVQAGAQPT